MIGLLAFRQLFHRPWRSALLFAGYGLGVAVMIVLLSVGEALIAQARDERLVGGGEITVLPEGIDLEVMKTGGLGGMFFSIGNARFIQLQLLAAPRLSEEVAAVAPQVEGKLLYLRTAGGRELPVRASGEIPSMSRAVGAGPELVAGRWEDDDGDRRWTSPTPYELRHDIDRFHLPPDGVANPESWAEWHYANLLSNDGTRWTFVSYIVAGDVRGARWGGQLLVTTHEQGGRARRFSMAVPRQRVRFSTASADVRIGDATVTVREDGSYRLAGTAREEGGGATLAIDVVVRPEARAYFPGADLASGDFTSGYAVSGLRASADGSVCIDGRCERYDGAIAYKDHNWGVWRGVSWEWGELRAGPYALLWGRVDPPDTLGTRSPLFAYLVDSLGFVALFRPREIAYEDARTIVVDGRELRVPARASFVDVRGADTLRVELDVEDAVGTDTRRAAVGRNEEGADRRITRPYFIQMKGRARLRGRVAGVVLGGQGPAFFETYR